MKQKILCFVALVLPFLNFGQTTSNEGINWAEGLSWQQILKKAKHENKYIFVDCFATWCKPCKQMDKEVYTVDSVGDYLNKGFISVKVQMDQAKSDDAFVKSWYKTANCMKEEYNLNAYPTLLFFTSSGEVATKEVGYKDAGAFLATARNSKDPSKQYYTLLKNYKMGKLDDAATRSLINTAKQIGDTINYHALRNNYFAHLHALPKDKLYVKENIEFIASTISRRTQPVFDMFYPDGADVDQVMQKDGYARNVVDQVITKEKVNTALNVADGKSEEPDWTAIYSSIAKDYNTEYATRNVLVGKILWYGTIKPDILKFARSFNEKMEKYGSDTTNRGDEFRLNNNAFLIWQNLGKATQLGKEEISELARVSNWMAGVVRRGETATDFRLQQWPLYIDTYANLLYKIGKTHEGILWEEFAIRKGKEVKIDEETLKSFEESLELMRQRKPTWPIEVK
jgi:thioredoxin-related protein